MTGHFTYLTKCIYTNILASMTTHDLSYLDCNCFAIRQAARFVSQLYERHVSQAGVTAAQFTLLAAIHRRPGVTMVELADAMVMERTTLVRALKPLQRDGLVTALQVSCAQFEKVHATTVTYAAGDDIEPIDADTALCLYRITQEALRNVVKHAAARQVEVVPTRTSSDDVELSIADDGNGFDLVGARARPGGLGLVSIDERVRSAEGTSDRNTPPRRAPGSGSAFRGLPGHHSTRAGSEDARSGDRRRPEPRGAPRAGGQRLRRIGVEEIVDVEEPHHAGLPKTERLRSGRRPA